MFFSEHGFPTFCFLLFAFVCIGQAAKADLKAKTAALLTNERQRGQYEAIAKSKQQVGWVLPSFTLRVTFLLFLLLLL